MGCTCTLKKLVITVVHADFPPINDLVQLTREGHFQGRERCRVQSVLEVVIAPLTHREVWVDRP